MENIGGSKFWRIWQMDAWSPNFSAPKFLPRSECVIITRVGSSVMMHMWPHEANDECSTLPKKDAELSSLPEESRFKKLAICCNKHGSLKPSLLDKPCWPLHPHVGKQWVWSIACMESPKLYSPKRPFCAFTKILFLQFHPLYGTCNTLGQGEIYVTTE